jgi:hypothetical protein
MVGVCPRQRISPTYERPNLAAAHNQLFQNFILFEEFQIALPLNWIGIILRAN